MKGYSSVGRTPVSKTGCRGFESSCPCQTRGAPKGAPFFAFGRGRGMAKKPSQSERVGKNASHSCRASRRLGARVTPAPAKPLGRFRSDREKTRKAEISRDFSAFFAPNFFQISIDPFSIFLRVEGFELPKTHFFMN